MPEEDYTLVFYPRVCICITSQALSHQERKENWEYYSPKESYESQDLDLWVVTGSDSLIHIPQMYRKNSPAYYLDIMQLGDEVFPLAQNFPKIERQLENDYRKKDSYATRGHDGAFYTNPLPWEYRVTGVKDFNIVATTPLFGQEAGTSLNRHFVIAEFLPKQIISYRTNSLVWGYRSKNKVETIDQWMALKPMAPPAIVFRLKETPPEVPTRVQFVSILETTDGKVLRDTTEVNLK